MGLDVMAYETATLTEPHERTDECREVLGHVEAFVYEGFEPSLRGLEAGRCYAVGGEQLSFRAGSYSGYGVFRLKLSLAALGVEPKAVWDSPAEYAGDPFFELVNFADNEGTIGPEAAADLAADFREERERVVRQLARGPEGDYYVGKYDLWARAFEIAAGGGLVELG